MSQQIRRWIDNFFRSNPKNTNVSVARVDLFLKKLVESWGENPNVAVVSFDPSNFSCELYLFRTISQYSIKKKFLIINIFLNFRIKKKKVLTFGNLIVAANKQQRSRSRVKIRYCHHVDRSPNRYPDWTCGRLKWPVIDHRNLVVQLWVPKSSRCIDDPSLVVDSRVLPVLVKMPNLRYRRTIRKSLGRSKKIYEFKVKIRKKIPMKFTTKYTW